MTYNMSIKITFMVGKRGTMWTMKPQDQLVWGHFFFLLQVLIKAY